MTRYAALILLLLFPLTLVAAQSQSANTKSIARDIAPFKAYLKVIHDGQGHYVVLAPLPRCGDQRQVADLGENLFYGDGKRFFRIPVQGSGGDCGKKRYDFTFWDPRVSVPYKRQVHVRDDQYELQCDKRVTKLEELPADAASAMLDGAQFYEPLWDRTPHRLARDDHGSYYLVDVRRDGSDHRMWIGPRGNMKLQKMRNIVSDSQGEIYATARGQLRLVFNNDQIQWIRGKRRVTLVKVPIFENAAMIYNDLGIYDERLGTPCDDL